MCPNKQLRKTTWNRVVQLSGFGCHLLARRLSARESLSWSRVGESAGVQPGPSPALENRPPRDLGGVGWSWMNSQWWTITIKKDAVDMMILLREGKQPCIVLCGSRTGIFTSKWEGIRVMWPGIEQSLQGVCRRRFKVRWKKKKKSSKVKCKLCDST